MSLMCGGRHLVRLATLLWLLTTACAKLHIGVRVGEHGVAAKALEVPSLVETASGVEEPVCVRNVPNVRGVLRDTCCGGLKCGFVNGVCCEGGSHCCPMGTVCVEGDPGTPPGCLHVMDAITSEMGRVREQAAQLRAGFVASNEQPVGTVPLSPPSPPAPDNNQPPAVIPYPFATGIPCTDDTVSSSDSTAQSTTTTASPTQAQPKCDPNQIQQLQQEAIANEQPMSHIVYEDAMTPHNQNAFSQYRVEKTSRHHIALHQGLPWNQDKIVVKRIALEQRNGMRSPPVPPSQPSSSVVGQPQLARGGNPAALLPTAVNVPGDTMATDNVPAGTTVTDNNGQRYNVVIQPAPPEPLQ